MNFYLYNHQNKGIAMVQALESAGWTWTAQASKAEVVFSDVDLGYRRKSLDSFHRRGCKIFLIPHAARPNLFQDFPGYTPYPHIAAEFVSSPGHIEIMQISGVTHPLEIVGWSLCPIVPFRPRVQARKILFGPIHPNADGSLTRIQKQMNIDTYKKLIALVDAGWIDLTVRYLGKLENNGIWDWPGVTFVNGKADQSFDQIDQADLVVSHQTLAILSIARGVPTVMMGEWYPPMICENHGKDVATALHFDQYKHLLMYPLDILAEADVMGLFARAVTTDLEIRDWRARMIGDRFDPGKFVETVKRYL